MVWWYEVSLYKSVRCLICYQFHLKDEMLNMVILASVPNLFLALCRDSYGELVYSVHHFVCLICLIFVVVIVDNAADALFI